VLVVTGPDPVVVDVTPGNSVVEVEADPGSFRVGGVVCLTVVDVDPGVVIVVSAGAPVDVVVDSSAVPNGGSASADPPSGASVATRSSARPPPRGQATAMAASDAATAMATTARLGTRIAGRIPLSSSQHPPL
jgi:hypothetical protein